MKKFFVIGLFLIWIFAMFHNQNDYTLKGKVIDKYTVIDNAGMIWNFQNVPYRDDTEIIIHFDDNCTQRRTDDKIIKITLDN